MVNDRGYGTVVVRGRNELKITFSFEAFQAQFILDKRDQEDFRFVLNNLFSVSYGLYNGNDLSLKMVMSLVSSNLEMANNDIVSIRFMEKGSNYEVARVQFKAEDIKALFKMLPEPKRT